MLISVYASYVFYLPLNLLFSFISGLSPVIHGEVPGNIVWGYGESTEVLWRYSRREVLSEVWGRVSYHALQVSKGLYWFQTGFKPLSCPYSP